MSVAAPHVPVAVTWHDAESGGYAADLPLWRGSPAERAGRSLDLGPAAAGSPSTCAARAREVVAVDSERCCSGARRAGRGARPRDRDGRCDVRELELGRRFPLVLAPMQLLHMLGGAPDAAPGPARRSPRHLAPGGTFAAAILAEPLPIGGAGPSRCPTSARSAAGSTRACRSRSRIGAGDDRDRAGCASSSRRTAS